MTELSHLPVANESVGHSFTEHGKGSMKVHSIQGANSQCAGQGFSEFSH